MFTLQTASGTEVVPGSNEEAKIGNLVARRSIILALVGSTPEGNASVDQILANGYLGTVKLWLNDILKGTVGTFSNVICPKTVIPVDGFPFSAGGLSDVAFPNLFLSSVAVFVFHQLNCALSCLSYHRRSRSIATFAVEHN